MPTLEVKELYDALVDPSTVYADGKGRYERLRKNLIEEIGYDAFCQRQHEAFLFITQSSHASSCACTACREKKAAG